MGRTLDSRESGRRRAATSDRGLSNVVAFVITFSIIIVSVTIVSTAGLGHLTELRDAEQVQSAERAMQGAATDMDRLDRGDPAHVLSFTVDDRSVWVNESWISINVTTEDGTGWDHARAFRVNALEHRLTGRSDDISVVYESGAVMRSDGAEPAYRPDWHAGEDAVILTLVNITTDESIRVSAGYSQAAQLGPRQAVPGRAPATDPDSTVQLLAATNLSRDSVVAHRQLPDGTAGNVTVNVTRSANPVQWQYYLEAAGWEQVTGEPNVFRSGTANETILIRERIVTLS